MKRIIRIGTRESQLALWQANFVKNALEARGHECLLVPITSDGELNAVKPIYEIGVTGVFTKTLDIALLSNNIDIAVHSLKDVPTQLPIGIKLAAVPKRGDSRDALITKDQELDWKSIQATIATSSIRRKAQWLHRYPTHEIENIRGNINTRLHKLENTEHWNGAIFAAVGIERIGLPVPNMQILPWMVPAPAQGALGIVCRKEDLEMINACEVLNDAETRQAVEIERGFLKSLMGGCATPIACFVEHVQHKISLFANIVSLGPEPEKKEIRMEFYQDDADDISKIATDEILSKGGRELLEQIQNSL